jgi:hypothetical protein
MEKEMVRISGQDVSTLNDEEQKTLLATNIAEVIAILTDEDHTYFDFDRSKQLLANYKADLGKIAYDYHWQIEHDKKYPEPSDRGLTDYQSVRKLTRNKEENEFLNPTSGKILKMQVLTTPAYFIGAFKGGRSNGKVERRLIPVYCPGRLRTRKGSTAIAERFPYDPSEMGWAVEDFLIRN